MNSLKIPYALTQDKKIINPQKANKDSKLSCPQCNSPVILKKGDIRKAHFAHKIDTQCSHESVTHATAKKMIIYAWKNPTNMISPHHDPLSPSDVLIFRRCKRCGGGSYGNILVGDIGDIDDIKDEVMVGNYRVDVAFMSCKMPQFAIEVVHTHETTSQKWNDFKKWKFPCIEIEAQHIIDRWDLSLNDRSSFRRLLLKPIKNNFNNNSVSQQRHRYDCLQCNPELFGIDSDKVEDTIKEQNKWLEWIKNGANPEKRPNKTNPTLPTIQKNNTRHQQTKE